MVSDPFHPSAAQTSGFGDILARGARIASSLLADAPPFSEGPNTRIFLTFRGTEGLYMPHLVLEGVLSEQTTALMLGSFSPLPDGPDGAPRVGFDPRPLGFRSPAFPFSLETGRDGPLFEVTGISSTDLSPTLVVNPKTGVQGVYRASDFVLACLSRDGERGAPKSEPGSPEP